MDKSKLVGLPLEEAHLLAEYYNYKFRVIAEDNQFFMRTMDYNPNRINVHVKDGVVTLVADNG